ncbi:hypothetical protein NE237_029992 [Protea cynaroides]|uniref:Uncharacterized protein n=1 Tax=Protea cynaroides TaxID=273540 RepID=A0A9Q0GTC1_9MAGN|nr:hypothetical protein NE237_029992 [Protea cynaroides]
MQSPLYLAAIFEYSSTFVDNAVLWMGITLQTSSLGPMLIDSNLTALILRSENSELREENLLSGMIADGLFTLILSSHEGEVIGEEALSIASCYMSLGLDIYASSGVVQAASQRDLRDECQTGGFFRIWFGRGSGISSSDKGSTASGLWLEGRFGIPIVETGQVIIKMSVSESTNVRLMWRQSSIFALFQLALSVDSLDIVTHMSQPLLYTPFISFNFITKNW